MVFIEPIYSEIFTENPKLKQSIDLIEETATLSLFILQKT